MFVDKVDKFIKASDLIANGDRILACVSGGVDSMVMLDVLTKLYDGRVGVAHCNFGLRPKEADLETDMVIKHCFERGIECYVARFDTNASLQKGESIQMVARRLRYDFFEQTRLENGYHKIAIAHNFDDKIETFFINLTRGAGIRGLQGIAVCNGLIIRPLLSVTRAEIEGYATENQVQYMNDSSNSQTKYLRNKIRHQVVPIMRQCSSFDVAMERVFENLDSEMAFLESCIDDRLHKFDLSTADKYLIYRYLERWGFGGLVAGQVYDAARRGESGKRFYSDHYVALIDRGELVVEPIQKGDLQFDFTVIEESFDPQKSYNSTSQMAFFDAERIDQPLLLRGVEAGDWFVPFGMRGRKKVNDFLKDSGVNLLSKRDCRLLCCGEDIVWVVGLRTDDRYKITLNTKTVLKVVRGDTLK